DDRLAAVEHRLDEVAGHAGEGEKLLHVHADQRTDDIVDIAAGAEIAAVGQEHHRIDVAGIDEIAERVAKLGIAFEGQRVLALRPVEPDGGDAIFDLPEKMLRLQICHGGGGHSCPSQLLRKAVSMPLRRRASSSPTWPSSSLIQLSWAVAMRANVLVPASVSRTIEVRRSPLRRARVTSPS